ncbi:hypothetical protein C4565_05050 [Candidatus Parcubacteria bacterium]|nr:MAG: hypothetical protein C4565_05050 [Candidatus Parcubacteria bacterium]
MTILNHASDGLYPELIVLFRVVAYSKRITSEDLVAFCSPPIDKFGEERRKKEKEILSRLRGALSRWTTLGLFTEKDGLVQLNAEFTTKKKESIDDLTNRLPYFCRHLVFEKKNSLPMWDEKAAIASDFVRGVAWLLTQNIYNFPTQWDGGAENIEKDQVLGAKTIVQNDFRWNDLRFWSRYLGFATGDSNSYQIDPTTAVKDQLPSIFGDTKELPAKSFIDGLSSGLPVLDFGSYRKEMESNLDPARWRKPAEGHLSMSLSLALQRLAMAKEIRLVGKADAGSSYRLTGRNFRTWGGFEFVEWVGGDA